jgi:hypothetical protein
MDSPNPTSPLAAAAALSFESCAAVLQTALSVKPLKTDSNSRNIDPVAGSAAAAAALAFQCRNDLKSVLDSLRRRAQAILLKLGFEALVTGSGCQRASLDTAAGHSDIMFVQVGQSQ